MADLSERTPTEDVAADEMDMGETGEAAFAEDGGFTHAEGEVPKLILFADLVKSPIVEVIVPSEDDSITYSVHEAVLNKVPQFAEDIAAFAPNGPRQIFYNDADADAMGSLIEYLYTNEYFPKRTSPTRDAPLENDPRLPEPDESGTGLLVHARIYTLADRLSLSHLKSLAHSKIHRTASTAKGELAYARYVYKESSPEDSVIRKPVAAFWATRSFSLRHEAEPEFKAMCLEFPQFSYDVLNMVLDQQERKGGKVAADAGSQSTRGAPGSSRKRARVSLVV